MLGGDLNREDFQAPMSEINTTPLVDLMLVLMVIFLVTAPMMTQSVSINLPKEKAGNTSGNATITISISNSGTYYLDKASITEAQLQRTLVSMAKKNPKQHVYVRADTNASYGKVNHALAAMQRAGLNNVELLTEPTQ